MTDHIPFSKIIKKSKDLITPHSETVKGFQQQARQKISFANNYVKRAKSIKNKLQQSNNLEEIINDYELKDIVLYSVGLSTKAQNNLSSDDLREIAKYAFQLFNDNKELVDEIIYRYLLTAGDSLGGTMRNLTGALAQKKFVKKIIESLKASNISFNTIVSSKKKIQIIFWDKRILLFDKTPKFIGKNIDVLLIKGIYSKTTIRKMIEQKKCYIALGELKGGIDPAGADEHWKTASKALERIREAFKPVNYPNLFFAGTAIEVSMAKEIYSDITNGKMSFAANLTSQEQTNALVKWLISL